MSFCEMEHRNTSTPAPIGPWVAFGVFLFVSLLSPLASQADTLDSLIERLDKLEEENRQLRREIEALKVRRAGSAEPKVPAPESAAAHPDTVSGIVRHNSRYGFEMLDPTSNINRKQRLILDRKQDGTLATYSLNIHGAVTAVADFQASNRDGKFGYLMRHPTTVNQVGDEVSEAAIHSAQFGFTAMPGPWFTAHAELLFDPEQSFGAGTNTDLERNQVQVRRAYALLGNLERSPVYASIGKMDVPFGLTDTVNPFTASTFWHAFGGLANGVRLGYAGESLNLALMGVQGGAQFRAANMPVEETAVPSRLNNHALDASYTFDLGPAKSLLLGGSYLRGSAYCQDFPIAHFMPCRDNNPAFGIYGRAVTGNLTLKGEVARTEDVWPGTFNPGMPQFAASRVKSFDLGARYRFHLNHGEFDLSAEFSRFEAGPEGAPWEHQDQFVLGGAWFIESGVKLFAEYIQVDGFAPLNFMSGGSIRDEDGNVMPDRTISDRSARTDIFLVGINAAF